VGVTQQKGLKQETAGFEILHKTNNYGRTYFYNKAFENVFGFESFDLDFLPSRF
jgi:hypothetical protein